MNTRIHHLNCGTMCPVAMHRTRGLFGHLVCHCLLVETEAAGLVLIDTGIGLEDIAKRDFGLLFDVSARAAYDRAETAAQRVEALGFARSDVRHIVCTHLDLDHAGGLSDFPAAQVHVHALEREAAFRRDRNGRLRYVPRHWAHAVRWQTYRDAGERWEGFEAVRPLDGLSDELALVPLHGHSLGHCGVAVKRPGDGWLLHCGDAFFHRSQVEGGRVPWVVRAFQNTMVTQRRARNHNIERLAALHARRPGVAVFCAHDPVSFASLAGSRGPLCVGPGPA